MLQIVDLGYAQTGSHTTRQRTIAGTFPWMAPEVYNAESVMKM